MYDTQISKLPAVQPSRKNFNLVTPSQQIVAMLPRYQRGTIPPEFIMNEYSQEI